MTEQEIHDICKKYNIAIGKYTINEDGSIDVDGSVYISSRELTEIPLKFNKVSGNFNCQNNYLSTLEGSPKYVGGVFNCYNNQLTSLQGSPNFVDGYFDCHNNKLTNLVGCPKEVGGSFNCYNNNLTSLEGCPNEVNGYFYCDNNPLESLKGFNLPYDKLVFDNKEKLIRKTKLKILDIL